MFRRIFFHGIAAAALATLAALVYQRIYFFATEVNFSKVINLGSLAGSILLGCLLAVVGCWAAERFLGRHATKVFNLVFVILSFGSILLPIAKSLPLDLEHPEMFYGLAIPMHLFPALAWFTLDPWFYPISRQKRTSAP